MDQSSRMALEKINSDRGAMYGFLARLYREEIDQEWLDQMRNVEFTAEVIRPETLEGYQLLKESIESLGENAITDLAVEYARIFLGFGPKQGEGAFPYESVYTSPQALLMQEARDEVVEFYQSEGLAASMQFNEPEDHLAFELVFMMFLSEKIVQALQKGEDSVATAYLQKQEAFLNHHLMDWVPDFCKDVQRIAGRDFYKAVAKITCDYLHMEQEMIGEMLA